MTKILTIVFIGLFFITVGSGQSDSDFEFTDFHNYSPVYSLIPMPNEVIVNKGGEVNIDLYVSGLGMIKENKILLRIPPELLDSNNPGQIEAGEIVCVGENSSTVDAQFKPYTVGITNMEITLSDCTFMAIVDENSMERTLKAPMLLSERDNNDYAPIHIKMNIAKNAPPGDQYVYLVFTYTDGTKWYQDKEKIKIHVNNPFEKNIQWIFVMLSILGLIFTKDDKIKKIQSTICRKGIKMVTLALVLIIASLVYVSL